MDFSALFFCPVMEGVIQYRLLGNHPAASGRYFTVGFPGENTTANRIIEQVIQEQRINTSRFKLDVCKIVAIRGSAEDPAVASRISADGGTGGGNVSSKVVPLYGHEELHTYDRLTITVSKRQLTDEDASQKEREQVERQRRLREVEDQLLMPSDSSVVALGYNREGQPQSSGVSSPAMTSERGREHGSSFSTSLSHPPQRPAAAVVAVDAHELERAATLAGLLFPILPGQQTELTSIQDSANNHRCVLCRLPAYREQLTPCCRFSVCSSCLGLAKEMVMKEGQCPVCGEATGLSPTSQKRNRSYDTDVRVNGAPWKKEENYTTDEKYSFVKGSTVESVQGIRGPLPLPRGAASTKRSPSQSSLKSTSSKQLTISSVHQVKEFETYLRGNLDQILSMLDAPVSLTSTAKSKRVMSTELLALDTVEEQQDMRGSHVG